MSEDETSDPEIQTEAKGGLKDEAVQEQLRQAAEQIRASSNGGALGGLAAKAMGIAGEIKDNFKADEGTEGANKAKSMFANLWKSGIAGKVAIVVAVIVVYKLVTWIF